MITIPTLKQIYDDTISAIESEFSITIPSFGKNVFRSLSSVQSAKLKLYYLLLAKVQKNIFVDTAEPVSMGGTLERFGIVKLGRSPFPAVAGEYSVTVTGTLGATIPAQTTFKSDDSSSNPGYLFILDNEFTLTGTTDTITLRALTAGQISELSISDTLTATAPIANVNKVGTISAISIEPLDAESIETYRQRAIEAYRSEPQGGAVTDYRLWASDAQGVANSYPYAKEGDDGIISLFVEATIADSTDGKGTPSAAILSDVEAVVELDPDTTLPINERGRRPLGVFQVNYLPITVVDVDITITGGSYTANQKTAITAAITEGVDAIRPFIAGADVLANRNDVLNSNKVVFMIQSTVPSVIFTSVTLEFDTVALSTYTFLNGEIPYLASVTYA